MNFQEHYQGANQFLLDNKSKEIVGCRYQKMPKMRMLYEYFADAVFSLYMYQK